MSIFLKLLPLELDQITEFIEPHDPVGEAEHVVGVVSDDLKKLYTLHILKAKAKDEAVVEAKYASPDLRQSLTARADELNGKAHVLWELFRVALNDEFELWDKPAVGVRVRWQVVWYEKKPPFSDFFRGLFPE